MLINFDLSSHLSFDFDFYNLSSLRFQLFVILHNFTANLTIPRYFCGSPLSYW